MARMDDDGTKYELRIEFDDWLGNKKYLHVCSTEAGMLRRRVTSSNGTPLGVGFMHELPSEPLDGETAEGLAARFADALAVGGESKMPPRVISARRSLPPKKDSEGYTPQQVADAARSAGLDDRDIVELLNHLPTKSGERVVVLSVSRAAG